VSKQEITPGTDPVSEPAPARALNRQISEHLRQASRQLAMQSGSRRGIYATLGLRKRRRDRLFRLAFVAAFLLCFAAPMAGGLYYLFYWVSPQYEAESRFVLRSALPALPSEEGSNDASAASLKIVQDTLVVISYLDSSALVQQLDQIVGLEAIYGRETVDPLWRLPPQQSIEDKTSYFSDFISTHVSSSSGIVTVKTRAFAPEDAQALLDAVLELAEERVNQLNREIWSSVLGVTQKSFDAAAEQLRGVRERYVVLQNETGVFDVELEAEAMAEVIATLRSELINLQNQRDTLLREVPDTHINVKRFEQAIAVRSEQLAQLEADVASGQQDTATLSNNQQRFEALNIEIEIAQDRFKDAAIAFEKAKLLNSVQLLYLDRFLRTTLPQDSVYPVYVWESVKLLFFCLVAWGAAAFLLSMLQKRMD
jgi:capsular polysaccharide transport system permease protein